MRTRRTTVLVVTGVALLSAGCSGNDGRFNAGGGDAIECMEHQDDSPGMAYTGGEDADSAAILQVFRYYVANGSKPYCDGEPPSDNDREWAQLVVDLGGSEASVAPILEAG